MLTQIFISGLILVCSVVLLSVALLAARLITKRRKVFSGFQAIDVQLRRRHRVVQDLTRAAQAAPESPRDTIEKVALLNSRAAAVQSPTEREHFESALSDSLRALLDSTQEIPACRDCPKFSQLSADLHEIEQDLDKSTRFYNDAAHLYNQAVDAMPARLIAPMFSLDPQPFFQVHPGKRKGDATTRPHFLCRQRPAASERHEPARPGE